MGYFNDRTARDEYISRHCQYCANYPKCRVLAMQIRAEGKMCDLMTQDTLDAMIPREGNHNGACSLYVEAETREETF